MTDHPNTIRFVISIDGRLPMEIDPEFPGRAVRKIEQLLDKVDLDALVADALSSIDIPLAGLTMETTRITVAKHTPPDRDLELICGGEA